VELEQPYTVTLDGTWSNCPTWWHNIIHHIDREHLGHQHKLSMAVSAYVDTLSNWFLEHYNTRYCPGGWSEPEGQLHFPNRETYLQCVLTWT